MKHLKLDRKYLKKVDDRNLRVSSSQCQFAKNENEYFEYKCLKSDKKPLGNKTVVILNLKPSQTLKKLGSSFASVHHLSKVISNLAELLRN